MARIRKTATEFFIDSDTYMGGRVTYGFERVEPPGAVKLRTSWFQGRSITLRPKQVAALCEWLEESAEIFS